MGVKSPGSAAVFCAVICPSAGIGLFIRQPDRPDPQWKMASGEVEPNESIPAALLREVEEETGFVIPSIRDAKGALVVGTNDCRCVFLYEDEADGRGKVKHRRKEDDEETIETKVFSLADIAAIPDFLWNQRDFLHAVLVTDFKRPQAA
jgi:8-oxo-dGTP pyrophosphatase MutT (NUDIX family)